MGKFEIDSPAKVVRKKEKGGVFHYTMSSPAPVMAASEVRTWGSPYEICAVFQRKPVNECDHIIDFEKILRQTYYYRLDSFLELEEDWDGANAAPLQKPTYSNSKYIFDLLPTTVLNKWDISPAANGSLLLSLKNKAIGVVNIGNNETSYVAVKNDGTVLTEGKERFDALKVAEILENIADKLSNGPVRI